MSDAASRELDLQARAVRERICFNHLCTATGSKEGQNAFLGKAPRILNCWLARFGGRAHVDSPPDGISEKVVVAFRYVERYAIEELMVRMLNSLPIENVDGVWYFGPRIKYCPDIPEIVDLDFEVNGQKVPGFAADLELFAGISMRAGGGA